MRTVKIAFVSVVAGFALVACNNVDSKIDKLEKACDLNNSEQVTEILVDLEEDDKNGDISKEQQERIEKIEMGCAGNMLDYIMNH